MKLNITSEFEAQLKFAQGADLALENFFIKVDDDNNPVLMYKSSQDAVPEDPIQPTHGPRP